MMIKTKLEQVFAALSPLEDAMPQPAGGSGLSPSGLSFREELAEAAQRLKRRGVNLAVEEPEDPATWY